MCKLNLIIIKIQMNNLNAEDIEFAGPHPDAVVQLAKRFRSKADLYTYMRDIIVSQLHL